MRNSAERVELKTFFMLERLNSSVNGNPRYRVTFTDKTVALTQPDASCAYGIENRGYRDVPLLVTFTRAGRIAYFDVAPKIVTCDHAWVSGMVYVDSEDVQAVALARRKANESMPECDKCGAIYDPQTEDGQ